MSSRIAFAHLCRITASSAMVCLLTAAVSAAVASSPPVAGKVLRSLSPTTGSYPIAAPTLDPSGALYGTTTAGGTLGFGSVYKLVPSPTGPWKQTIVYNFDGALGGGYAYGGVILDASSNLYGTTIYGGASGVGEVYELLPQGAGKWTFKTLYSFNLSGDGYYPMACLVFDQAGNLYGTTYQGGTSNLGTVFELTPDGSGGWTETILHSFSATGDGSYPLAPVIFDSVGNLYGTTSSGGTSHRGTVFELSPSGSTWTETILYNFTGLNGDAAAPEAGVVFDPAGNLYGTTVSGGKGAQGTAYKLSPGVGFWTETTLHSFLVNGHDGYNPLATLVIDPAGNLYGTTANGGMEGKGIAFELLPNGSMFRSLVLRSFSGANDGSNPYSGVIRDSAGNLYGTTTKGGSANGGVVYRLTP